MSAAAKGWSAAAERLRTRLAAWLAARDLRPESDLRQDEPESKTRNGPARESTRDTGSIGEWAP
jgi:hypothetical protein